MRYVPMHVHSTHSLGESTVRIRELVARAKELGLPAVALADVRSMAAALTFSKEAAAAGVQPIVGVQIPVRATAAESVVEGHVVLLAKDENGEKSLYRLLRELADAPDGTLGIEALRAASEGLIAHTGGVEGIAVKAALRTPDAMPAILAALRGVYGDRLFLAVGRTGHVDETRTEAALLAAAAELEIPPLATCETFFLEPEMHEAHDVLLCISGGTQVLAADRRRVPAGCHLRTPNDFAEMFADLPEAVENTLIVAKRCARSISKRIPMLPTFTRKDGLGEADGLRKDAKDGLDARLVGIDARSEYDERLENELNVIERMGFPGYFLMVADFIGWARENDIAVGPGRGSGAGSLVAWSLRITDLDPIRHGLLFERFLNPDRVSMPDFDVDFEQERRDEVVAYVRTRYGSDRVAQIATYGKLQARAVVRDVGRAMQIPFPVVDRLCRMIPNNPTQPTGLAEAMGMEPLKSSLERADSNVSKLFEVALRLEGLLRHASTHAAGVVVADRPVAETVPVMRDASGALVTQYDMKSAEDAGLVKFDFLGLKTLDVIQDALRLSEKSGVTIDMANAVSDAPSYAMLARGDSFGVFQLESAGMRGALRQIAPTRFEDLVALVALYRPGPMDNIPTYAEVKNGNRAFSAPHPVLAEVLRETNGVIIYQEQVMEIARKMAGYTLAQADLLRRAMGKKIREEMEAQRRIFTDGCIALGHSEQDAGSVFDLLARFADYGFNKSHAAAYARIAIETAFLRKRSPEAFFAASMNVEIGDLETISAWVAEARRAGVRLLPPDVNRSETRFSVEIDGKGRAVRHALSALRGIGKEAMGKVALERAENGTFRSVDDFLLRTQDVLNRKAHETLARAGALDGLGTSRAAVLARIAEKASGRKTEARQFGLFDGLPTAIQAIVEPSDVERLLAERVVTGTYFTGHPLTAAAKGHHTVLPLARVLGGKLRTNGTVDVLAMVHKVKVKMTKNHEPMAVLVISDQTETAEIVVFGDDFERLHGSFAEEAAYLLTLRVAERNGERSLYLRNAVPFPLR
jgi:DNA polymerase-3 subunit alpha